MSSPYPWYYNLRWLFDYFAPSTKNATQLVPAPRALRMHDEPAALRIAFLGDLMCMQNDRIPDVAPAIRAVLEDVDLVVANCEAPLMFEASRPFARYVGHFAMAEEFLFGFLDRLGVPADKAVLSVANNHIADQGVEGLAQSIDRIRRNGAVPIGARTDEGASPVVVVERSGLRIGFAAWTNWLNSEQRLPDFPNVFRTPHVVGRSDLRGDVDLLIGSPHWEFEFRHFPRAATREAAAALADAGFDVVVGHHPHVLQPIERFGDRLCLYSIGNLNGPALERVGWPVRLGGIFVVDVGARGPVGWTLHPFVQRRLDGLHVELIELEEADHAMRERFDLVAPV